MIFIKEVWLLALVCLSLSVQVSSSGRSCGLRSRARLGSLQLFRQKRNIQGAIVGGLEAEAHSWPWQVSIRNRGSGSHFCGGSIIDDYWIITAAHCLDNKALNSVKIVAGDHSLREQDGSERTYFPQSFIQHEAYNNNTFENDIALIELREPVEFSAAISPVCLPTARPPGGEACTTTGWGSTRHQTSVTWEDSSDRLQQADIPIIDHDTCSSRRYWGGVVKSEMICAGNSHIGICFGDSGGPLVCNDNGNRNHYYLAGVTSFGWGYKNKTTRDAWCSSSRTRPSVFTSVHSYKHWISSHLHGHHIRKLLEHVEAQQQKMAQLQVNAFYLHF